MPTPTEDRVRGVYFQMKPERNGRVTPTLRVGWIDDGRPRRTTVSITKHGVDEAVRIALAYRWEADDAELLERARRLFRAQVRAVQQET